MSNRKRNVLVIVSFCALILLIGIIGHSLHNHATVHHTHGLLTNEQIKKNIGSSLSTSFQSKQKSATKKYLHVLYSGNYTENHMYVQVNPYKTSPLSALLLFQTAKKAKVSYTVVGKTEKTSLSNTISGYTKNHEIPIVGLYADYANTIRVTLVFRDGTQQTKTIHVQTAKLSDNLKNLTISIKKADKDKMIIGKNQLTVLARTTQEPFAVDADGEIRWYSTQYTQHIFKQLRNGHILLMQKKSNSALVYNDLVETDYLGKIYKQYQFKGTTSSDENPVLKSKKNVETTVIHHDVIELPNGDLLATVSDGSKYIEDTMAVISHKTGKITRVIDMKRIMPKTMWKDYKSTKRADGKIDWFHQNSINYDASDKSIVISSRHQDLVMKFTFKTMKPVWIFSGKSKTSWPEKWQRYVLKTGKNTTITGGQHAAFIVPDSDSNRYTESLLLYDNNYAVTNGDKKTSGKYSQGVQYLINTKTMTIKDIWSYGKVLGQANFTDRIGDVDWLNQTHRLIDFGYLNAQKGNASNIIETDGTTQVFNFEVSGFKDKGYVYRAYRVPFFSSRYVFNLRD